VSIGLEVREISRDQLDALSMGVAKIRDYTEAQRQAYCADVAWWIFGNPTGVGVQAGLFEGDRLAGIACITPKPFRIGGQPATLCEIGGTETSKDFQGRGVFSKLVTFLEGKAKERGYGAMYGTPNEASGRIYMGKLGWSGVFHWQRRLRFIDWSKLGPQIAGRMKLPGLVRGPASLAVSGAAILGGAAFDAVAGLRTPKGRVRVSAEIDDALPELLALATKDRPVVLDRTGPYLKWRYSRPGRRYEHLYRYDSGGRLCGWAVFDMTDRDDIGTRMTVHDFWAHPWTSGTLNGLLQGLAAEARTRRAGQLYLSDYGAALPAVGRAAGFASQPSLMPVIVKPISLDLAIFRDWDYRPGDADMA
jgi:GNAT superfamily N-acetyltransferase